jgi:hypothetical protein
MPALSQENLNFLKRLTLAIVEDAVIDALNLACLLLCKWARYIFIVMS